MTEQESLSEYLTRLEDERDFARQQERAWQIATFTATTVAIALALVLGVVLLT